MTIVSAAFMTACSSTQTATTPSVPSAIAPASAADNRNPARSIATPAPPTRSAAAATGMRAGLPLYADGNDTSNDICASWCVIQGQTQTIGATNWGSVAPANAASVRLHISDSPAGVAVEWVPVSPSAPAFSSQLRFTVASGTQKPSALNRYGYYAVWTMKDGTTSTTSIQPETIQVACSIDLAHCPQGAIFDDLIAPAPKLVSGSPPPTTKTFVGQEQNLTSGWRTGTGTPGYTYAIQHTFGGGDAASLWTILGTPVKSYDITAPSYPGPIALGASDIDATSVDFYWVRGADPARGDALTVSSVLSRSDNDESANVTATAHYQVRAPRITHETPDHTDVPRIGPYTKSGSTVTALSAGELPNHQGIVYDFQASVAAGGDGNIAGLQTIANTITTVPASTPNATNNATYLDTCPLFANATPIAGGGSAKWSASDAPFSVLGDPLTSLSRLDFYDTYFMYEPNATSARKSIWVSLAQVSWQWRGTAQRSAAGQPWPTAVTNPVGVAVTFAGASARMPSWAGIYNAAGSACPSLP